MCYPSITTVGLGGNGHGLPIAEIGKQDYVGERWVVRSHYGVWNGRGIATARHVMTLRGLLGSAMETRPVSFVRRRAFVCRYGGVGGGPSVEIEVRSVSSRPHRRYAYTLISCPCRWEKMASSILRCCQGFSVAFESILYFFLIIIIYSRIATQ